MAGRPKYYTDEELIDRAIEVFWKHGYAGASAKDLMKGMDIGQGSFYRSFPGGKKELYQKSLIRFLELSNKSFLEGLENSSNPIEYLKHYFHGILMRPLSKMNNGCYLGNSLVELSNLDQETHAIASNLLKRLQANFQKALEIGQKEGKLDAAKSPALIALHLLNLWNGINVTQRMDYSQEQLTDLLNFNLHVLN
jgi:TetR/AcrR family transcriptional repressor of nem operon